MAIVLDGANGSLFYRIGRFGKLASIGRTFSGSLETYFNQLLAQFDSSVASPMQQPVDGVATLRDQAVAGAAGYMSRLQQAAARVVIQTVMDDRPSEAGSLEDALREVVRQMESQSENVDGCTVTATSSAGSTNSGNGAMAWSTIRGDTNSQQLIFPETAYVTCITDAQTGGGQAGQEVFRYQGEPKEASPWHNDYPTGSGASATIQSVTPTVDGEEGTDFGNVLVNGDFEDSFTSSVPANWTVTTGTAAVDYAQETSIKYSGSNSFVFISDGTDKPYLEQAFNSDTGSPVQLKPLTTYIVNMWCRVNSNPAAGTLVVALWDDVTDTLMTNSGGSVAEEISLTALGTTFVNRSFKFQTPKDLPASYSLRIRAGTAITNTHRLYIDHVTMARATALYDGGPGVVIAGGSTDWVVGDFHTLTTTQDYSGASNLDTFQWLFDRLFNTRSMGIILPYKTPSISDTLITS